MTFVIKYKIIVKNIKDLLIFYLDLRCYISENVIGI